MAANPDPGIVNPGREADAPHGQLNGRSTPPDPVDQAIAATAPVQGAIDVGIGMQSGAVAHMILPIPLTPVDVVRLMLALTDVVAGRTGNPESDDIKQRMAARGLSIPS